MNLFPKIKSKLTRNTSSKFYTNIPADILKLLYFKNGPLVNINSGSKEPSAIDINLPVSARVPSEILGYYPKYQTLTPEQRGYFLNWLCDRKDTKDIGYVFLYLYSLERCIYEKRNIKEAVLEINRLQKIFKNDSFLYYSSTAIIFAAIKSNMFNILDEIDTSMFPDEFLIVSKILSTNKLFPKDIIIFSKYLGYKEKRYIQKYPEIFELQLTNTLKTIYDTTYFPCYELKSDDIPQKRLLLSNFSLTDRELEFPDFSKSEHGKTLYKILKLTHEETKKYLRKHNMYKKNTPVYSYEGHKIPEKDLETIQNILETGKYKE